MSQSSSYCFTNISSCCAGGFPSHLFPKLSSRPNPLLFIKSDGRPQIGLGWLQGTISSIASTLQKRCWQFISMPDLGTRVLWGSERTVIARQRGPQRFAKDGAWVGGPLSSASCSSVWLLCRTVMLSFLEFTWGKKKIVADRLKNVKNYQCIKIRAKHGENLVLF